MDHFVDAPIGMKGDMHPGAVQTQRDSSYSPEPGPLSQIVEGTSVTYADRYAAECAVAFSFGQFDRIAQIVEKARKQHCELSVSPREIPRKERLEMFLNQIGLSVRITSMFSSAGIHRVREVVTYSREDLLGLPGFAGATVNELQKCLHDFGFELKPDDS